MKENRKSVMAKVLQLQKIIDDVGAKLGPGEELPSDLREHFRNLEGSDFSPHTCCLDPS